MLINNACGEAPRGHGATHGARVVCWSHGVGGGATGRARPRWTSDVRPGGSCSI